MPLLAVALAGALAAAQTSPVAFAAPRDYAFPSPYDVVIADFNRDARPDIAVANAYHQSVTVVIGGGAIQTIAVGSFPTSIARADFNADLLPDLVVTNSGSDTISVLLGVGDGTFQPAQHLAAGVEPRWIAVADFNGDQAPDLSVSNAGSADLSILLGRGDGTFLPATSLALAGAPSAIVAGDFNHDSRADIAVAVGGTTIALLRGTGLGTFLPPLETSASATWFGAFAAADFNGDGDLDLAAADPFRDNLLVFSGNGLGTFSSSQVLDANYKFYKVAVGDFNGDARPDLAAAGWWPCGCDRAGAVVYLAKSDGTFQPGSLVVGSGDPYSVAVGDLDGDRAQDLVIASLRTGFATGTIAVRFGKGDGAFWQTDSPGATGRLRPGRPETGDFNGDERPDLAVVFTGSSSCGLAVALGRADGTLQSLPIMPLPENSCGRLVPGDFNGDSRPDLAITTVAGVLALLGNGDGTFAVGPTSPPELDPTAIRAGDFDGDGHLDLVSVAVNASFNYELYLQLGDGDGTFRAPILVPEGSNVRAFAIADFDGDARLDLALADPSRSAVSLLPGNGDGTFQPPINVAVPEPPAGVIQGDLNGDGRPDLVVSGWHSGSLSVLLAAGAGTFQPAVTSFTPYMPKDLALADVNGDRSPDLLVLNSNTLSILRGAGDGTLSLQPTSFATLEDTRAMAVADFTADGRPDAILAPNFGGLGMLVNVASGAPAELLDGRGIRTGTAR